MPVAAPYSTASEWRARRGLRLKLRKQVSRVLRRLATDGLARSARNPMLDPLELEQFQSEKGWERFRHYEPIIRNGFIVGETVVEDRSRERFRHRIVETLASQPEGVPYRHLLEMTGGSTASGRESGTWRRAFADLVDSGTVIPARARFITPKGRQALRRRTCMT